jgi:hypothetical protein
MVSASLALPASAPAAAPVITNVQPGPGNVTVSWTLPPGQSTHSIEVADSPAVDVNGAFGAGHVVGQALMVGRRELTTQVPVSAGTRYIHVASYGDPPCTSPLSPLCVKNFSATVQVTVEAPPPDPPYITITFAGIYWRLVIATWSKVSWLRDDVVEIATSPEVYSSGPNAGAFLDENTVSRDDATHVVDNLHDYAHPRTFRSRAPLAGGVYWVHVSAVDSMSCTGPVSACRHYYSNASPVSVPYYPPELATLGHNGHRLNATWVIGDGMWSDLIEVATRPEVYPAGPDRGSFLAENTVIAQFLDPAQTGWSAPIDLPPGKYYVHVGDITRYACVDPNAATCLDEFSAAHVVVIPDDPTAPTPPKPPDRITAFTSLVVPSLQRLDHLFARAAMGEAGTITAKGKVEVAGAARVYAVKRVSAAAAPGAIVKLRLTLSRKALKAARKAIQHHRRVKATITIRAKDLAGNVAVQTRAVALKN